MATAKGMNSNNTSLWWSLFATADPSSIAGITATWGEITDVVSINGTAMEVSVTELTHLRSPSKAKEKVPGYTDGGQVTFKLNYYRNGVGTTATANAMNALRPGGASAPDTSPAWGRIRLAVVFPDQGVWVLTGFIKSLPFDVPEDNRNTIDVTFEISGLPIFLLLA